MNKEFYRGEIFYIRNESEYSGNVQGGGRPAVIISNDIGNNAAPILEVVYLTTQEKKPLPTHVKINSSKYPSTVLCEQIDTVNKDKVGDYIGQCSMAEMKKIDAALAVSIGIGINIKSNDLVKKWAEAANEAVKPDEKEPEPIAEKVEMPDIETQLEIAKITAERDVYKRLYEDAMALIKRDRENFWMLNWLDEYMTGHKGFICGGCFKNIFNKEKVKDLDIFFENESDFDDAVQYFDSQTPGYDGDDVRDEKYHFHYENDNVKAYKHIETGVVIELCCKIFGKPEEILNKFDFTITKFAYYKEEVEDETGAVAKRQELPFETLEDEHFLEEIGIPETHIEYKILMDDAFFEHLHLKRIVIDKDIPFPMSTFERMLRYAKYGYFPCKETKMKIINALRDLTDEQVELSESLYDGMD